MRSGLSQERNTQGFRSDISPPNMPKVSASDEVPTDFRKVTPHTRPEENHEKNAGMAGNVIVTSKYTVLTFLPVNLFHQFSRIANLYFLFIGILQLIPGLSPTHWFTTVAPLVMVLTLNAVKEIYDDYHRHQSDKGINGRAVARLKSGKEEQVEWRDIVVGDIVKVNDGEEFPSDLIFLASADVEGGLCYVETANLDGETNLKIKNAFSPTQACAANHENMLRLLDDAAQVECEKPNNRLYQFEGSFSGVKGQPGTLPLDANHVLLRGSTLRKTKHILGLVVFAGEDSKIMKNMVAAPRKVSQLERHMNLVVICIFMVLTILSLVLSILQDVFQRDKGEDAYYAEYTGSFPELAPGATGLLVQLLRYIILLNQLIPISLYVTLEMVKVIQSVLLNKDRKLYWEETDTPFNTRTTNLNEELGQVQYVLSDKTGTLTQNVMQFVWCSVGGKLYGRDNKDGDITTDAEIKEALHAGNPAVVEFVHHLATCNTVLPTHDGPGGSLAYQAASPDEEALVDGAAGLGVRLVERTNDKVCVEVDSARGAGVVAPELEVLAVLDFTSARKRMSALCRDPRDGAIRLYTKGADSVMYKLLAADQPDDVGNKTKLHIDDMCRAGYRTLCVAMREVDSDEYERWIQSFQAAQVSLTDREGMLASAAEEMERDLVLLGATAVEDKLQVGVPGAITSLLEADIKVWMLTGDKLETACSIALSCNLLPPHMSLIVVGEGVLVEGKHKDNLAFLEEMTKMADEMQGPDGSTGNIGLVIEGTSLISALLPELEDAFMSLCKLCRAVVCCRVSPIQKAQVTHLVKTKAGAITLGIGDGANDVGMIKAAHIGVGISGREGRAAVLASDYAMAQFPMLARLLLVHGRWSYKRNREIVLYAFYKNFTYAMANVYLSFYSGFSSQPIYASALIATYNVFWTSLPTVIYGVLEQDVSAETVLNNPALYTETQREGRKEFMHALFGWMLAALWHSVAVFFVPLGALGAEDSEGKEPGIWAMGVAVYTCVIVTVNLKVAARTRYWTWVNHLVVWGISIGLWFPFVAVASTFYSMALLAPMAGAAFYLFGNIQFWLAILLAPLACMLADISYESYVRMLRPAPCHIFQELEREAAKEGRAVPPERTLHKSQDASKGMQDEESMGRGPGGSAQWEGAGRTSPPLLGHAALMTVLEVVHAQNGS